MGSVTFGRDFSELVSFLITLIASLSAIIRGGIRSSLLASVPILLGLTLNRGVCKESCRRKLMYEINVVQSRRILNGKPK
jgi:hypothetical protein